MFYLNYIKIYNFLIFKDTFTILQPLHNYAVIGNNRDETTASSNGVGKTLFFDAITWCLYGRTLRNLPVDVIKGQFAEETYVETKWVDNNGEEVIIKRSIKKDTRVYIKIGTNEIIISPLQANEQIIKLFGIDYDLFRVLVISGQEQSKFCDLTNSLRIKILSDILKLDDIDKYYSECNKIIEEYNNKLQQIELKINSYKTYRNVYKNYIKENEQNLVLVENEFYNLPVNTGTGTPPPSNNKVNQTYLEIKEELATLDNKIQDLVSENKQLEQRLDKTRKNINRCPYCNSIIKSNTYIEIVKGLKDKLQENTDKIAKYQYRQKKLEIQLQSVYKEYKKLEKEREDYIKTIQIENKAIQLWKDYSRILDDIYSNQVKLSENYSFILEFLYQRQGILKDLEEYKVLREWYSNKGIRNKVILNVIDRINKTVNLYIKKVFGENNTLTLEYDNNKLEIYLISNNIKKKYEWLSGGQKSKVKVCFDLAFNDLIPHSYGLIILDEITGLDNVAFDKVFNMLRDGVSNKTLLVVSHNNMISDYFNDCIIIEKSGGISQIANRY